MVAVPASVPLPGFVPIATVTFPVNPVAVLLLASSAVTCTAGVIAAPADVLLGCTENTSCVAVPAVIRSEERGAGDADVARREESDRKIVVDGRAKVRTP